MKDISDYSSILGFGKKPALFISDIQTIYADPSLERGMDMTPIFGKINQLIRLFRQKHYPIYFSVIEFNEYDLQHPNLWLKKIPKLAVLKKGSDLVNIASVIDYKKNEDKVISKRYPSAFFATDFSSLLSAQQVDTLVITGATTCGCVRATAVDCLQYGFRPIIVNEAVTDRWPESHQQALFELHAKYADVVNLKQVEQYLEG